MTCATFTAAAPRQPASVREWVGCVLSGAMAGFLALEGLSRILFGDPIVSASAGAPTLEPSLELLVGIPLLLGAFLQLCRTTRWPGVGLMLLSLAGLVAVEFAADQPAADPILFWAYVAGLLLIGATLRAAPTLRLAR